MLKINNKILSNPTKLYNKHIETKIVNNTLNILPPLFLLNKLKNGKSFRLSLDCTIVDDVSNVPDPPWCKLKMKLSNIPLFDNKFNNVKVILKT